MFRTPVDIANRALNHIGQEMISTTDFSENSKRAQLCSFTYEKLRRAELRRNVWRFAIRKTVLRPINSPILQGLGFPLFGSQPTPTLFLSPALWVSTIPYYPGAIVSDSLGMLWINDIPDNLGNEPGGLNSGWEQYFGPISAQPYDPTTAYYAGEIVYNTVGDGQFRSYVSLQNGNSDVPTVPTLWGSSVWYYKDQIVIWFPAWQVGTNYAAGQCISYQSNYYASLQAGNLGHTPGVAASSTWWALIPAPPTAPGQPNTGILEWVSDTVYGVGNFVDYAGIQYVSVVASNVGLTPPANTASWKALTNGTLYRSMIDANMGNEPDLSPASWASGTTYAIGATVSGSDGQNYTSLGNGNVGHNPVSDGGVNWQASGVLTAWSTSIVGGSSTNRYQTLSTLLVDVPIMYPVGSGPSWQQATRNVFRLPANFLREAPQSPKTGSTSPLGAPSGLLYEDWELEGNYIVTWSNSPILFRFVADVADVTLMDDMFCEGLACRMAVEICEPLTQSTAKVQSIEQIYQKFMTEARVVNGIETGATEPPLDDFIACRT